MKILRLYNSIGFQVLKLEFDHAQKYQKFLEARITKSSEFGRSLVRISDKNLQNFLTSTAKLGKVKGKNMVHHEVDKITKGYGFESSNITNYGKNG